MGPFSNMKPTWLQDDGVTVPERHLGLHMPADEDVPKDLVARLGRLMEEYVDLDLLLTEARSATVPAPPAPSPPQAMPPAGPRVRIGVAKDAAFSFYYWE